MKRTLLAIALFMTVLVPSVFAGQNAGVSLSVYDYVTGGDVTATTKQIGTIITVDTSVPGVEIATAINVLGIRGQDFKGQPVAIQPNYNINKIFTLSSGSTGKKKVVIGPFTVIPPTGSVISGGLVVDLTGGFGPTSPSQPAYYTVSSETQFNKTPIPVTCVGNCGIAK